MRAFGAGSVKRTVLFSNSCGVHNLGVVQLSKARFMLLALLEQICMPACAPAAAHCVVVLAWEGCSGFSQATVQSLQEWQRKEKIWWNQAVESITATSL